MLFSNHNFISENFQGMSLLFTWRRVDSHGKLTIRSQVQTQKLCGRITSVPRISESLFSSYAPVWGYWRLTFSHCVQTVSILPPPWFQGLKTYFDGFTPPPPRFSRINTVSRVRFCHVSPRDYSIAALKRAETTQLELASLSSLSDRNLWVDRC